MRQNGFFYRADSDDVSQQDKVQGDPNVSDWLVRFAEEQDLKQSLAGGKTAVEAARERQRSILEMMSNIMGGSSSKFSSVEEVVKDYQRRTGLDTISQKKASDELGFAASLIIEAGNKDGKPPVAIGDLKSKIQKLCAKLHGAKAADVSVTLEKVGDKFVASSKCKGKVKGKACLSKKEALNSLIEKLKGMIKAKGSSESKEDVADVKKHPVHQAHPAEPIPTEKPEAPPEGSEVIPERVGDLFGEEEIPTLFDQPGEAQPFGSSTSLDAAASDYAAFLMAYGKKKF
jgi:hypothetical protein